MSDDPIFPLKRQLADEIIALADTVPELSAARRLGIDPARVRDLRHGRIARFSVEWLIRRLMSVGCRVTISIAPPPNRVEWYPKLRAQRDAYLAALRAEAAKRRERRARR